MLLKIGDNILIILWYSREIIIRDDNNKGWIVIRKVVKVREIGCMNNTKINKRINNKCFETQIYNWLTINFQTLAQ